MSRMDLFAMEEAKMAGPMPPSMRGEQPAFGTTTAILAPSILILRQLEDLARRTQGLPTIEEIKEGEEDEDEPEPTPADARTITLPEAPKRGRPRRNPIVINTAGGTNSAGGTAAAAGGTGKTSMSIDELA